MTENSLQTPIFDSVSKPHREMKMEELIDRTLLWLGSLNIVSRMMAVTMMGLLCLIAN